MDCMLMGDIGSFHVSESADPGLTQMMTSMLMGEQQIDSFQVTKNLWALASWK